MRELLLALLTVVLLRVQTLSWTFGLLAGNKCFGAAVKKKKSKYRKFHFAYLLFIKSNHESQWNIKQFFSYSFSFELTWTKVQTANNHIMCSQLRKEPILSHVCRKQIPFFKHLPMFFSFSCLVQRKKTI